MQYPPPHYILFEPLNDIETQKVWKDYKEKYDKECEFAEIDAAEIKKMLEEIKSLSIAFQ